MLMICLLLDPPLSSKAVKLLWFMPAKDKERRFIALNEGSCVVLMELS